MIQTSSTYKELFENGAIQDYRIAIDGVTYTQEHIKDTIQLQQNLLDKSTFTVGSFTIGVLKVKLKVSSENIPHNANVVFSYRYNDGETQSEWIDKFKGKITKRNILADDVTEIEVKDKASNYDVFLDYFGDSLDKYPANTRVVANLCAKHLGLEIENIEDVVDLDIVDYPNESTMVEMLKNVARNSGGNWVIVGDKLRLVTVGKETNQTYPSQSIETSGLLSPISKVVMYYDDESAFESGTNTGSTIEIDSKWATQDSTDYVHSVLNGFEYIPVKSLGTYIDPAIELGDIVTIDNQKVMVSNVRWFFDGIVTADIEVPINNEENYDDPYNTLVQNQFKRKVSLGDSYQGVTISRDKGIEMLVSPDGTEENAIGRYYADLYRGIAFQSRDNKDQEWHDWMYFDLEEKTFKMHIIEEIQEEIENIELTPGPPGPPGKDGKDGEPGADGKSLYTWIKYADTPTSGMSDNPTGKKYVGFAYNKSTPTESTNYADYEWQLVKGEDGLNGQPGKDGKTYYNWIAYADSSTGGGISLSPTNKKYVGYAFNKETKEPSLNPKDYQWQLVKGEDGKDGERGPQGLPGKEGPPGKDGKDGKTYYTWVKYADGPNGEGISDSAVDKTYIGLAFNKETEVESSDPKDYEWSLMPQHLTVGGRNLILDSKHEVKNNCNYLVRKYDLSENFIEGETYTFSMRFRNTEIGTRNRFWVYNSGGTTEQATIQYTPSEDWQIVSATFKSKDYGSNNQIYLYHATSTQTGCIDIDWVQLEKGDIATDWTPAPEDLESYIKEVEQVTTQNSAGIEGLSDTVKIHGQKITTTEQGIKDLDGNLTNLSKTVTEESGRLDVAYNKIEANVESINAGENIIPNLNGTTGTYRGWDWENSQLYNHPRLVQRDGLRANTNFLITELTDSLSRFGLEFYSNGSAISPVGYVVPGSQYSFKGKRAKGSQPYKVIVREYRGSTLNKSTTFTIGSGNYGEFSITPQATSDSVRLEFVITGVTHSNPLILTEMMFNRGIPNRYKDTPGDVKFWASTQVEQLDDKLGVTTSKVDNLDNDIHNTTVDITPENGVEIWSTAGNGLTVYDQSGLPSVELTTSGKIKAIDAEFINALITGNLVAGKISGLVFDNNAISFPDGKLELNSSKNAITFGRMEMKHSTHSTQGGTTDVIEVTTPTGKIEFISGINYPGGVLPNTLSSDAVATNFIHGKFGGDGVVIGGTEGTAPTKFTDDIISVYGNANIGSSSKRWSNIYLQRQPNVSSDHRQKSMIEDIPDKLVEMFMTLEPKQYVQNGQVHFGYIAQDVERIIFKYLSSTNKYNSVRELNEDAKRYAVLYKDETFLSLLYGEITILKDAYYKRKIEQLECDIIELKKKPRVSKGFRKRSGR